MRRLRVLPIIVLLLLLHALAKTADCQGSSASTNWKVKKIAFEVPTGPATLFTRMPKIDIFVMDSLNSKPRRLVEGESPAWSPDGERIAYCIRKGPIEFGQIQIINADGSGQRQLTNVPGGACPAVWSPDGGRVAYCAYKGLGLGRIQVINADGSGQKQLAEVIAGPRGCSPNWSPDGEKIAFTSYPGKTPVIAVMGKNGENAGAVVEGYGPLWSPDGKQLLFYHDPEKRRGLTYICVANADGTEVRILTEDNSPLLEATWSPDGKSVAFASQRPKRDHKSAIYSVNLDGTGPEKIAADKKRELYFPVLSPDRKQLLVDGVESETTVRIFLIDLVSHQKTRLVDGLHPRVLWEKE